MQIDELYIEVWQLVAALFTAHVVRYLLIAGGAYVLFYLLLRRWMMGRKIQPQLPRLPQMRREVLYSMSSFAIFAFSGLLTVTFQGLEWGKLYGDLGAGGWGYYLFTVVLVIVIHDTWFYWTHRLMHWPPIFRVVHRVHHLSHNPSPWASFSFHPLEAVIHAIMFPLVVLVVPMHYSVAGIWLLYMTLMNVGGHLGFEILPRGFARHPLLGWHNTATHHDMHHHHVRCNYSLYFNVWDRLMGTNHPEYVEEHDRVTAKHTDESTADSSPFSRDPQGSAVPTSSIPRSPSGRG